MSPVRLNYWAKFQCYNEQQILGLSARKLKAFQDVRNSSVALAMVLICIIIKTWVHCHTSLQFLVISHSSFKTFRLLLGHQVWSEANDGFTLPGITFYDSPLKRKGHQLPQNKEGILIIGLSRLNNSSDANYLSSVRLTPDTINQTHGWAV